MKTDKNLGPAVLPRDLYVQRALSDHLSDRTTYQLLSATDAMAKAIQVRDTIASFIRQFFPDKKDKTAVYLQRSLPRGTNIPLSKFYLLAKVHKTPWKTRPIVSYSGSVAHGLGKWVDKQLQLVCSTLPFVIRSSFDLCQDLKRRRFSANARFFSLDAVSMYTNIDTPHALHVISLYLTTNSPKLSPIGINVPALIAALRIVMTTNVFQFGDTYWLQLTGTAMGTPPAPMYATLYYAIHEIVTVPSVQSLAFYGRYIDDGLGIWDPPSPMTPAAAAAEWQQFCANINTYGKLTWEFTPHATKIDFLDLTLTLHNGVVETELFEKALNLYLYLPATSCHSPSVLKSTVFGYSIRIFRLTSDPKKAMVNINNLASRLLARGYQARVLRPIFAEAIEKAKLSMVGHKSAPAPPLQALFLHLPYNPVDMPSSEIQQIFKSTMQAPPPDPYRRVTRPLLSTLRNHRGAQLGIDRLIVAYGKQRTLGDILSPSKFRPHTKLVSDFVNDATNDASNVAPRPATTDAQGP